MGRELLGLGMLVCVCFFFYSISSRDWVGTLGSVVMFWEFWWCSKHFYG